MQISSHNRGLLISFAGVLILSPDSLLIRLLKLDDLTLIFYRGLLPVLTITVILVLYYRNRLWGVLSAVGWAGIVNGFLYAITNITFIHSIQITSVANTLVILSSAPVFAAFLCWILLREKQRPVTWVVIIFSMVGIFIIGVGSYQSDGLTGDLLALVCALSTACSAVLVRFRKSIDLVPSVIIGSLMLACYGWLQMPTVEVTQTQFIYIGIIGFILVPLAFLCLTVAPRFTSSAEVQLVFLLEAILGPLWVWMVIGETPSENTLIGGAVLLISVSWFAIKSIRQPA
ncbi:MAG: DMT family transporter [Gammaproteobacteria bacterium]|nr:DMT family transporter [Gammaproteobacteria bacterium]